MKRKKKEKRSVSEGCVYIQATFNNTIVTVTDMMGNNLGNSSAGALGFRGAKKSTPYAARNTVQEAVQKSLDSGLQEVHVYVKGPGIGRESAIRSIVESGIRLRSVTDITPIPHNGCRPRKLRRG